MTIDEFNAFVKKHDLPGSHQIRVHAMGGMRIAKSVAQASVGFDWNMNSVVLHPVNTLQLVPGRARMPVRPTG